MEKLHHPSTSGEDVLLLCTAGGRQALSHKFRKGNSADASAHHSVFCNCCGTELVEIS